MVIVGDKLFVANPSSDRVTMLGINTTDPTDITYQSWEPSQGYGPTALAGTDKYGGVVVCVSAYLGEVYLSGFNWNDATIYPYGDPWKRNLSIFVDGNMTAIGAVSQVSFSPNADYLVIQFKGLPNVAVMVFTISSNGTLSDTPMIYPPSSPLGPASFGFVFVTNTWIVTTDAMQGVLLYQINAKGVVNASYKPILPSGAKAFCWAAWDNSTNNIYAIAAGSMQVTEVSYATSPWAISEVQTATYSSLKALTDAVAVPQMYDEATKKWTDALFVLAPKDGIAQFTIKGKGMLSYVGVTPFPAGVNTTYIAGLASYSVWNYTEDGSGSGAALVHPSLLAALLSALVYFRLN